MVSLLEFVIMIKKKKKVIDKMRIFNYIHRIN